VLYVVVTVVGNHYECKYLIVRDDVASLDSFTEVYINWVKNKVCLDSMCVNMMVIICVMLLWQRYHSIYSSVVAI